MSITNLHQAIIVAGYSASGKTTLASRLAQNLGYEFVDVGSIVRQTALTLLEVDQVLEGQREQYLNDPETLEHRLQSVSIEANKSNGHLTILVNRQPVDISDEVLRQPFLDDQTLILARELRPQLIQVQRQATSLAPCVFSARNSRAFEPHEAIRIFIDPGNSRRTRRRGKYEYQEAFFDLDRDTRRDILSRVVGKEWKSIELGIALSPQDVKEQGFIPFSNKDSIENSLEHLIDLAEKEIGLRDWQNVEGSHPTNGKERQYHQI